MRINKKIIFALLSFLVFISFATEAQPFMDEAEEEMGSLSSDQFIDEKGDLTNKKYHIKNNILNDELIEKLYYDARNRIVVKRYYDHFGELYYDDFGIAVYEYEYDADGNRTESRYFDEYKRPFPINFVGPASIKYHYDTQNHVIKVAYYDVAGSLNAGMGIAVINYKYDQKGRVIEEERLDEEEVHIDFFAPIIKYKYDDSDRVIEKSYHTSSGDLTTRMMDDDDDDKIAIIRFSYLGGETLVELLDKNKQILN